MIARLLSYRPLGTKIYSLEHSDQEGTLCIQGVVVHQKKEEIDLTTQFTVATIKELKTVSPPVKKARLTLTTEEVLLKQSPQTGTDTEIIAATYPNLDLDAFYYQILQTGTQSYIAICRKAYVEELIRAYRVQGIYIEDVSLGVTNIGVLAPYCGDTQLYTQTAVVGIRNKEVEFVAEKEASVVETYEIESLRVPSTHTLPLATAIRAITATATITGNLEDRNKNLTRVYQEVATFKKIAQYGIGVLLVSLLINFFVFNSNYKQWQSLQETLQVYTNQQESIKQQQTVVANKEAIVKSILGTGFSKSSYFMDQLIYRIPSTVLLNTCMYQPLRKTIHPGKPIHIDQGEIRISGTAIDKQDFTNWVAAIEGLDFVRKTTIISYGVQQKNSADFELIINLTDDATH
ncbi:hypothetical protein ACFSTE_14865 [Aquimarina hainanensis]|uniref:Uncharacterized protein n=1 Tax=Aquimarina hainanensis TaxID=1578017 RepID=A0ABW5ND47_9FLAO